MNSSQKFAALFWIAVMAMLIPGSDILAQGGYAGAILRMGLASRSEAMGRAYTAVVGNPESAYYNPATMTFMKLRMIDLSYRSLSLDRSFAYVGFATRLHPGEEKLPEEDKDYQFGGVALSWIHASVSNIDGRDLDGEKFATFSNTQNAFNFSFALRLNKRVSLGIATHILWNRFPTLSREHKAISATSAALDFGFLVFPVEGLWIGGTVKNINGKYTWDSSNLYDRGTQRVDKFPKIWRFGVATTRLWPNLLLSADLEGSDQFDVKSYLGADYHIQSQIHFRAGLRDGNPTFGGSYDFSFGKKVMALHYAFVGLPNELSNEHVFSWSFHF